MCFLSSLVNGVVMQLDNDTLLVCPIDAFISIVLDDLIAIRYDSHLPEHLWFDAYICDVC